MNPDKSFAAIICAAGSSSRMGGLKKEYCLLPGTANTVLAQAVLAFAAFSCISRIIITVPDDQQTGEAAARSALPPELLTGEQQRISFTAGGSTRRASVHNAISALSAYRPDYVLIHDGSRPWVSARLIGQIMQAVQEHQAVIPLLPLTDTPKEISFPVVTGTALPVITRHLRRDVTGIAQTPQAFAYPEIFAAQGKAARQEKAGLREYTDDAEVWGEFCGPVAVIPGEPENRKITFPGDLEA